jgi:ABC-type multidrug transport system fused ATPase/permease subunit
MFKKIKTLYHLLSHEQRGSLVYMQILIIFMAVTEVAGVLSIGPFMSLVNDPEQIYGDNFIATIYAFSGTTNAQDFIIISGIIVFVILTSAALMNIFTIWKVSMFSAHVGAELSNRLFIYFMEQPWLFHAEGNSSELTNKLIQESYRLTQLVILPFMHFNARFVTSTILLLALLIYNPIISIAAILIFTLAYYVLFLLARGRLNAYGKIQSEQQALRFKLMSEGFGGIKDTLILGRQKNFIEKFIMSSIKIANVRGRTETITLSPKFLMELLSFGGVIALIITLVISSNGEMSEVLSSLAIFALAGFKILPAIQVCYASLSVVRGNIASFEVLEEDLFNSAEFSAVSRWDKNQSNDSIPFKNTLTFKDISFSYPGTKKKALDKINLDIHPGQFIGLVGSSGSGKSTLADVFLGLLKPTSGEIIIDNEILSDLDLRQWQNNIGAVSQSIFLSDSSIKENIAFGLRHDEIIDEKVILATRLANLSDFIGTLPEGLKTNVGERGIQLSGGQRQRIGIARALYNNASILVFDEATSALDGLTEKKVMDAIYNLSGSKTIITIAHRLATIKKCDLIYLLDEGKIIDSGKYDDLKKRNSLFESMTNFA